MVICKSHLSLVNESELLVFHHFVLSEIRNNLDVINNQQSQS